MKKTALILMICLTAMAEAGGCPNRDAPPGSPAEHRPADSAPPEMSPPPDAATVQRPADPEALAALMDRMKAEADRTIREMETELAEGGDPEELFSRGVAMIMQEMRPEFGPANAWLFNERGYKIEALCDKMGLTPERCGELEQEAISRHPE